MEEELYPRCAGLDIHKTFLIACRRYPDPAGQSRRDIRKFGTMLADLQALATWLAETGTTHVVMESTGVYWQPVFNVLEEHCTVWLVNAAHVKNVPGRKTDVKDAEWLAHLLRQGLLRPSFIPPREQRELREVVRYRQSLVEERTRVSNRVQKVLEDANIKLSSVVTDMQGVSAQAMITALMEGETNPESLATRAKGQLRHKQAALEQALQGRVRAHHRYLLRHLLAHLEFLNREIAEVEAHIEAEVAARPPFAEAVEVLDSIPGVDRQTGIVIVTEIGVDMSRFPSAGHLTAWAGLAPGNNQTGGKERPSPTRKGNRYLRRALVQAGHAAAHKKGSYLRSMYYRIARRRGSGRAAVAVGRTILEIAYHLIQRHTRYEDLGAEYLEQRDAAARIRYLTRELEKLNVKVRIEAAAEAA